MTTLFKELERLFDELKPPSFKNISELKEKGEVTEETETSGDLITKRIHFKSMDGRTELYRSITTNKKAEKYNKISELRSKINRLLRDGNFEDAIPLRDELRLLEADTKSSSKQ